MQRSALGCNIQPCLESTLEWMNAHFLCLDEDKTQIIVIAPPAVKKEIIINGIFLDNKCIRFVDSAKNLGVLQDGTHLKSK